MLVKAVRYSGLRALLKAFCFSATIATLLFLIFGILYPLIVLFTQAFADSEGKFVWLANFREYLGTPGLRSAFYNTLILGISVTVTTVSTAFILAYCLTHRQVHGRKFFRELCFLPLLVPSIFPAIGLIYLLGGQGALRSLMFGHDLYGPIGVFLASFIYTLPHATLLLTGALGEIDQNLYDAASTLGTGSRRRFFTVTIPNSLYGLVSAAIVVFILTITDFGIPKILGGDFNLLSLEIYKQIIGLSNFRMGAVAALILTLPTVSALLLDHWAKGRQKKTLREANARPPLPSEGKGWLWTFISAVILSLPAGTVLMVAFGSLIGFWPYDLGLTVKNYLLTETMHGWSPYINSLTLAFSVALSGTLIIFGAAYLMERNPVHAVISRAYHCLALVPLSIPGTVLGLAFVLSFKSGRWIDAHLFGFLIINTIIHLYPVAHLACVGALGRLPADFEAAGQCVGVSRPRTFWRVIVPLEFAVLGNVAFYLFINAMTTISALVFLYTPDNIPASVAILNMLDSGQFGEASAMSMLILLTALTFKALACTFKAFRRSRPNTF